MELSDTSKKKIARCNIQMEGGKNKDGDPTFNGSTRKQIVDYKYNCKLASLIIPLIYRFKLLPNGLRSQEIGKRG